MKIGNPLAVARLQAILTLADEAPRLTLQEVTRRLAEVGHSRAALTTGQIPVTPAPDSADLVRRLLRAVASGRELAQAAVALDDVAPGVAEILRIYGTGSADEADLHLASIAHLLRG